MDEAALFPWSLLGLAGDAATERDIKKAYARLVKQHRPDPDPEVFQRVHEAYKVALAILQEGTAEAAVSQETAAVEESRPLLPEEFRQAAASAQEAQEAGDRPQLEHHLGTLRRLAHEDRRLIPVWEQALLTVFSENFQHLIREYDLHELIEGRCEILPEAMVSYWKATGQTSLLIALGKFMLRRQPPFDDPPTVLLQARVAIFVAFAQLPLAENLANAVFPRLSPQMRNWVMPRLENRLALAKIFHGLPSEQQQYWEKQLCPDDEENVAWNQEELTCEFRLLTQRCPADWPGYQVLSAALPENIYQQLLFKHRPKAPKVKSAEKPQRAFTGRFKFLIIFLLISVVRNVRSCSESTPPQETGRAHTLPEPRQVPRPPLKKHPGKEIFSFD